ncbi:unnamed protein product [Didymodactylos carnosus]|uniref:Uncharacterized protein n=1 Tax=Didymodactylos carnosus TaxID=1234261 RepID=A0A814WIE4_9BILA|nr:unnamed protein product [Didymodactylos carnosus]CAF3966368.1 unnamed protein product [Didymodactylos carnosus]
MAQYTKTGVRSSNCPLNGNLRTNDGIIESCIADVKNSVSKVVERNLDLILNYPREAKHFVPNNIVNGAVYQRNALTEPKITIQLHSDGTDIMTTKHKSCYATTGSVLEIPPPRRDHVKNKILLSLYFGKKEPTSELLLDGLINKLSELRTAGLAITHRNRNVTFKVNFPGDKNELPCRAMNWKISQFNRFDCCTTNCLQHGETRNSNKVYYPYTHTTNPRTHQMFVNAAQVADLRRTTTHIAVVQDMSSISITAPRGTSRTNEQYALPQMPDGQHKIVPLNECLLAEDHEHVSYKSKKDLLLVSKGK